MKFSVFNLQPPGSAGILPADAAQPRPTKNRKPPQPETHSNFSIQPSALSPPKNAFTLLEVLIATAIFGMAAALLAAAYVGILESYENARKADQNDEDLKFARACFFATADLDTAQEGDQFESPDGRRIVWTSTIEPTTIADLFRVELTIEIHDPESSGAKIITQTFNILRPTWSLATDREALRLETRQRIQDLQLNTPSTL